MSVRATWHLVLGNLRQNPWQTTRLAGFVALAALMLNLGLMLALVYPHTFDEQADAARMPQLTVLGQSSTGALTRWLHDQPGVEAVEHEDVLLAETTTTFSDGTEILVVAVVADVDAPSGREVVRLRDGGGPLRDDGVWLPYLYDVVWGYQVGDTFTFGFGTHQTSLRVLGFTDDMPLGSYDQAMHRYFVTTSTYERLAAEQPTTAWVYTKVWTDTPARADDLVAGGLRDHLDPADSKTYVLSHDDIKEGRLYVASILAGAVLVSAVVVVGVSLLVVRFRVAASIEESMTSTGVLKALGYTSGQVAGSLLGQTGLVALAGSLVGVAASCAVLPLVAAPLELHSTVVWAPGFTLVPATVAVATTVGTAVTVSGVAAVRIRRLTALTALRAGLTMHSFRRNYLPLDRTPGGLTWLLAVKSAVTTKAQTITVGLVVAGVAFQGVVTVTAYDSIGADPEGLLAAVGGELPDVRASGDPDAVVELQADLAARYQVRKSFLYSAGVDEWSVLSTDDFSLTEGRLLHQGRWPHHPNETAISWQIAETNGTGIGDLCMLNIDGVSQEYLITGIIQTYGDYWSAALTTDGLHRLRPDHQHDALYVYLDDPGDAAAVVADVRSRWADRGVQATADAEMFTALMGTFEPVVSTVAVVVLAVSALIVTLVVSLVLSTVVLRGRRGFGIQKAIGFTHRQQVAQVVAAYLPAVAGGAVLGGAAGHGVFPQLMDALFQPLGVRTTAMHTSVGTTAAVVLAVVALGLVAAVAATAPLRTITPCSLVTEWSPAPTRRVFSAFRPVRHLVLPRAVRSRDPGRLLEDEP